METNDSTRPSSESMDAVPPVSGPEDGLSLPVEPDFRPEAPTVPQEVLIARSADLRRWLPRGIPTDAERPASKCDVPFTL